MSMKPRNLAPTCSKILLHCKNPWLPPFETSCAVPSLTATAGTTNILLLLPEQGGSKQLLSQGREEKQQEGWPTRPLFQVPATLLCCNLCQVSFRKIKFADFKVFAPCPHSPASFPSADSGCMLCRALSPKIHFPTAAGRALPHCPSAKLKRAAPRAAETATQGAWEVFKDLSGLCFDRPMQQKLGSLTTSRDPPPLGQSPATGWHWAADAQKQWQPKRFPQPPLHCHRYFTWLGLGQLYKMVRWVMNGFS